MKITHSYKNILYKLLPFILILFFVLFYFIRLFYPTLSIFVIPDFGGSDLLHGYYPIRYLLSESIKNNELPLWSSNMANGYPIFADGQIGAFVIANFIFYKFLPFFWAINISYVFIFFTIGVGTYLYAREIGIRSTLAFFSAIVFTFSGFNINQISHISLLQAGSFLPLEFYFLEKIFKKVSMSNILLFGFIVSQQILSGNQQMTTYSIISLFLYLIIKLIMNRKIGIKKVLFLLLTFFICLFYGILLSAVLLVPSYELLRESTRLSGSSYSLFKVFPYPLIHLLNFIFPFHFGNPRLGTYPSPSTDWGIFWENNGYIGLIPLFSLSLFFIYRNKRIITYGILLFLSILLVLGKNSPLYFIFEFQPLSYFRVTSRFLILTDFSIALLSALLIQEFIERARIKNKLTTLIVFFLVLIHTANIFYYFYFYYPVGKADVWFKDMRIVKYLQGDKSHYRIYTIENNDDWNKSFLQKGWENSKVYIPFQEGLFMGANMFYSVNKGNIVANFITRRLNLYNSFINITFDSNNRKKILIPTYSAQLLGVNAVKYFLIPKKNQIPDMKLVQEFDNYSLYKNPYFIERAYMVYDYKKVENIGEIFSYIESKDFNPQVKAISEKNLNNNLICQKKSCRYTIKWIIDMAQKIKVNVSSDNNGLFILSDTYYPGWSVYVDGKKTNYFPVNISQRGIFLTKGTHDVEYKYRPYSFKLGGIISLCSYLILLFYFLAKINLKFLKRLGK